MAYPPTATSLNAVLQGQEVWRLFEQVGALGQIFESDVSGSVFCLGPNSDVSNILITCYREDVPNQAQVIEIDTERPHVGRLDALASQVYGTGQKARILIAPTDNVQIGFVPIGLVSEDTFIQEAVFIDFMQYLTPPPAVFSRRADRTFFYQSVAFFDQGPGNPNTVWYALPYWGRRYASFTARSVATGVTARLWGVIFNPGTLGSSGLIQVPLTATTAIGTVPTTLPLNAVADGMYDVLLVQMSIADSDGVDQTETYFRVRTSDNAQGA